MLNLETAKKLKDAGLPWDQQFNDAYYRLTGGGLDAEIFKTRT